MQEEVYDIIVIGGGPAGMIAAIWASENGAKTLLVERNKQMGKKLLLTGKGRCNLSQEYFSQENVIEKLGKNGRFFFSALSQFTVKNTIDFFQKNGVATKTERGGRIFPVSDKANTVLGGLLKKLRENHVTIIKGERVRGFKLIEKDGQKTIKHIFFRKKHIEAKKFIICTGGLAYAATGSSGDGFEFAEGMGHQTTEMNPALSPIECRNDWIENFQGISLRNVKLKVYFKNKKVDELMGEMLFTHYGISGPIVLSLSKKINELQKKGHVTLKLDLKPALDFEKLDKRIQRDFEKYNKKQFKNSLEDLLPQKMIEGFVYTTGINPEKKVSEISKEERHRLVKNFKEFEINIIKVLGFDFSIITNGGIKNNEINSKTMKSKIVNNLYFAGEILNLDGPTGGYNLQICWSTGKLAGENAAKELKKDIN